MSRIDLKTAVGSVLVVFGLAVIVDSSLAAGVPLTLTLLVTRTLAAVSFLGAIMVGLRTAETSRTEPDVPAVETKADLPVPGEEIDETLARIDEDPLDNSTKTEQLREQLLSVGASVLADRYGLSESATEELIVEGRWSDDYHAVAFFTQEYPEWAPASVHLRNRVMFSRYPPSLQAEHALSELIAIANGQYSQIERAPTVTESKTQTEETDESV